MKKFGRWISAVLCMAMLFSLAACGKSEIAKEEDPNTVPSDPYEIRWYMLGTPQTDVVSVEKAVNEYLKDKINATVKITAMEAGQYKQKMSTMVSAGEYFDIAFCAGWMLDYATNAGLGAFQELDGYMDTYLKDVKETIPESFIESTRVGGKIYAVPTYKEGATQYGWIYRKDIADKYGINMDEYKTLEEFEEVAAMLTEKIAAKEVDIQYPIDWDGSLGYQEYIYDTNEFIRPVSGIEIGVSYCEGDDPTKIMRVEDKNSEESQGKVYREMRKYYKNGWVKKDTATATDGMARFNSGKTFAFIGELKPGKAAELQGDCPYPIAQSGITEPKETVLPGLGSMMAISTTSKNPVRCARFLNLLNTDAYLKNLIVHGIEGKHYEKVNDTTVRIFEDTTYSNYKNSWAIGNVFLDYITVDDQPDKLTALKEFNENSIKRDVNYFSFNTKGLELEIAEIAKVYKKYGTIGAEGSVDVDYEAVEKQRAEELNKAGLDKVIDEMQKQYDEYLKTRN